MMFAASALAITSGLTAAVTAMESGSPSVAVQAEAAVSLNDHLLMSSPSFSEPIDLDENYAGMAMLQLFTDFPMDGSFSINPDCSQPIRLMTPDGKTLEATGELPVSEFKPFVQVSGFMQNEDDYVVAVQIMFAEAPLTTPGAYTMIVPEGFFMFGNSPVEGTVFRYEIAGGEVSEPPFFEDLIIDANPAPSYTGEYVPMDGMGLASFYFTLDGEIYIDRDCEEDIVLFYDDGEREIARVSPATDPDLWVPPFISCNVVDGQTYIAMTIGWEPIVERGYYSLEFPEGLFKTADGVYLEPTMIFYEVSDGKDPNAVGAFAEHVTFSSPSYDSPFNLRETYGVGMAQVMFSLNLPMDEVSINPDCIEPIRLFASNGEILAEATGVMPETEFKPFVQLEGFMQNDEDLCAMVCIMFSDMPINTPGKYLVDIPEGFFMAREQYVGQSSFTFHMLNDGSMGAFHELVVEAIPDPSQQIDLSSEEYAGVIDALVFEVDGMDGFGTNLACTEKMVITKDGTPFAEISADASAWGGKVNYVEVYSLQGLDEGDLPDDFGGNASDDDNFGVTANVTLNPYMVNIVLLANPITAPGTYKVSIPNGFFAGGNGEYSVEGSEFEYVVVDILSSVDMFKADSAVTVYSINGMRLLDNAPVESLRSLQKGCYVINGKKVVLK